ncbi:MAG: ABC transporter substrate-binding protein, partial [Paracoccaceae bacterium]|nr:ABC transporter substrate-binding protein [Paracoccaceae bacterium]
SDLTRRGVLAGIAAGAVVTLARPAAALSVPEARGLIDRVVAEVNSIISSGRSEAAMIGDFERLFARYADVPVIARSVLGPAARQASVAQMRAYTAAFQGYIARKYGKRFREFIGGRIVVNAARQVRTFYEVNTQVHLRGKAPFEVLWLVSDRSGRDLFFNLVIEGVSMLAAERTEVQAMLDRRRGDIAGLTADLQRAG